MEYVVGFLFSPDRKRVALVRKNKPEWQKGKLNGIGGKIEPGEMPLPATIREFMEETGVLINAWRYFATLRGKDWACHFYETTSSDIDKVRTIEEEEIVVVDVESLPRLLTIPNIQWMIPLACDQQIKEPVELRVA